MYLPTLLLAVTTAAALDLQLATKTTPEAANGKLRFFSDKDIGDSGALWNNTELAPIPANRLGRLPVVFIEAADKKKIRASDINGWVEKNGEIPENAFIFITTEITPTSDEIIDTSTRLLMVRKPAVIATDKPRLNTADPNGYKERSMYQARIMVIRNLTLSQVPRAPGSVAFISVLPLREETRQPQVLPVSVTFATETELKLPPGSIFILSQNAWNLTIPETEAVVRGENNDGMIAINPQLGTNIQAADSISTQSLSRKAISMSCTFVQPFSAEMNSTIDVDSVDLYFEGGKAVVKSGQFQLRNPLSSVIDLPHQTPMICVLVPIPTADNLAAMVTVYAIVDETYIPTTTTPEPKDGRVTDDDNAASHYLTSACLLLTSVLVM